MTDSPKHERLPIGGGLKAVSYVLSIANNIGPARLAETVRSKNTCKACAFGTGGQNGGLHNEFNKGIEICNKNIQAQSGDMRPPIPPAIFRDNTIAELSQLEGKQLEALGRLATPLYKAPGAQRYECISYEKAFEIIIARMRSANPQKSFFYSSGRSSNEAAFILQLFARLFGSNHINNCSYYCHQASSVGLQTAIGTGTATIEYKDLHKADTIFVIGANPASNHPRFLKVLIECRRRGGNVVIINPAREPGLLRFASPSNLRSMILGGVEIASHYIQPHVGGDASLLQGLAKAVLEQGTHDAQFITDNCEGFEAYSQSLALLDWSDIEQESGVSREEIDIIAKLYGASQRSVFCWGMGLTHHENGVDNIAAVANLALLRAMIGGQGKGLLPLRGHSNVQGVGSMGFSPALKKPIFDNIESKLNIKLPTNEGKDTLACLRAAHRGEMDFAFLLGGNLYGASPDAKFADEALASIGFKLQISSTLNQSHVFGIGEESIVLPIRVRDEEKQATTQESMFNYLRLSDGGFDRLPELKSEVDIVSTIAANIIAPSVLDFTSFQEHRTIRQAIASIVPGFEALAEIDNSKQEFQINGRTIHERSFATRDNRAHFQLIANSVKPLKPAEKNAIARYRLTTVRSEGQFNTIVYTDNDVYRGQSERNIVLMNSMDMQRQGIKENDLVTLKSDTGQMTGVKARHFDIRQGNVMAYFPEANILIPQTSDPKSRTPAFKSIAIELSPER
ncbi:MAG: FdhF/YdeP family oxidoreductase [Pseudohongiellaceae bacterium]|nr:FdhF/YdeP family oxidoreductase [Pseudohongiellaceae bacterium]